MRLSIHQGLAGDINDEGSRAAVIRLHDRCGHSLPRGEQAQDQGGLGVQAVSASSRYAARMVADVVGDFLATMEAVHEYAVGLRLFEQGQVDLVIVQVDQALLLSCSTPIETQTSL